MKRTTICLFKVKSSNALLCLLLVCVSICLKSVLRYEFLIFFFYLSSGHYIFMSAKEMRICGYFSKPRGVRERRNLGNTALVCPVAPQETQAPTELNCVFVLPVYFIFVNNSLRTHIICMLNCRVLS
jgi:hypothetical protein